MAQLNNVQLLGNIASAPELTKIGEAKTPKVAFSLAVNRSIKRGEEYVEEVSYFDVEAFGSRAETISKHFSKGDEFLFCGEARQERWEDKDGGKRASVKFVVQEVCFTFGRKSVRNADRENVVAGAV